MRDEVCGPRAAVAAKLSSLGLRHLTRPGRGVEAHDRTAPYLDGTLGAIDLRRLIAHGIGIGDVPRQARSLALTTATETLMLSVCGATGRASPIAPPDLGEVASSRLGGTAARAVFLSSVAGTADGKLGAAPTTRLETDHVDASTPRAFALRGTTSFPLHVDQHDHDQIELGAVVQRFT